MTPTRCAGPPTAARSGPVRQSTASRTRQAADRCSPTRSRPRERATTNESKYPLRTQPRTRTRSPGDRTVAHQKIRQAGGDMSTFDVHPRTATPTSISLRSRLLVPAMAVAIALALLIAGVTAATHGASVTSANPLVRPAGRDTSDRSFDAAAMGPATLPGTSERRPPPDKLGAASAALTRDRCCTSMIREEEKGMFCITSRSPSCDHRDRARIVAAAAPPEQPRSRRGRFHRRGWKRVS